MLQDPHSSASACLAVPCVGFSLIPSMSRSVFPNQNNSVMLRLWMLQGKGVAQPGAEQLQGSGQAQGCAGPGDRDRDSAGTHL